MRATNPFSQHTSYSQTHLIQFSDTRHGVLSHAGGHNARGHKIKASGMAKRPGADLEKV